VEAALSIKFLAVFSRRGITILKTFSYDYLNVANLLRTDQEYSVPIPCMGRKNSLKDSWEEISINSTDTDYENWSGWKLEKHSFDDKDGSEHEDSYPKAQLTGGRPWGMSFMVKQSVRDKVCPQFDGKGVRVRRKQSPFYLIDKL
jgi:hypothetical protein